MYYVYCSELAGAGTTTSTTLSLLPTFRWVSSPASIGSSKASCGALSFSAAWIAACSCPD